MQGIFIEGILTAELVFTIFMLAKEKHKAAFIAPVGIGLAIFIAEMVGVYYTGGPPNSARSFGHCIVTGYLTKSIGFIVSCPPPVYSSVLANCHKSGVGPIIGSLIAVVFYKFIKMLEYEKVDPCQDGDDKNDTMKSEGKRVAVRE